LKAERDRVAWNLPRQPERAARAILKRVGKRTRPDDAAPAATTADS